MRIQTLRLLRANFPFPFGKKVICVLLPAILVAGCAGVGSRPLAIGEPETEVLGKLGNPTYVYKDGDTRLLEYKTGPWGQRTYMARIGADGRLISYEQVLTNEKFAGIAIGSATKDDVLRRIGSPIETSFLSLKNLEVWSYPYKESEVWNSVMHVHFDQRGVVQSLQSGPDLRFDPDKRFPFMMGL